MVAEGFGELLVDLGENAGEVPGFKILTGRSAGAGALDEAPAVLLEVMPVPVGEDGFHYGLHLGGRLFDLRFHAAYLLLRLVALNVALECVLFANGLDGFGVLFFANSFLDDRLEVADGCLRQALLQGSVVGLPVSGFVKSRRGRFRFNCVKQRDGEAREGEGSNPFFHNAVRIFRCPFDGVHRVDAPPNFNGQTLRQIPRMCQGFLGENGLFTFLLKSCHRLPKIVGINVVAGGVFR